MVKAYWNVGKYIVEYEQKGELRAEYGKNTIKELSARLIVEYGNGFTISNLKYMRQFYLCFPIGHAVRDQLSWTHYRAILKVQNEKARQFYVDECISENWSTRQLERQINTLFYERLLASTDKQTVRNEIKKQESEILQPHEIIRDPYILEFFRLKVHDLPSRRRRTQTTNTTKYIKVLQNVNIANYFKLCIFD